MTTLLHFFEKVPVKRIVKIQKYFAENIEYGQQFRVFFLTHGRDVD